MIKKYINFINESNELILESEVKYSKDFRKVLIKIDNELSRTLLSIEDKDLPVSSNYFDIDKDRNDYLFFTPDKKAQEISNDDKIWSSSNRQCIKVGRSMNALIKLANVDKKFSANDIEKFVNLYKMQIDKLNDKFSIFQIATGEDICEIYCKNDNGKGTLGSSCMSHMEDYYYTAYCDSKNISLVYFMDEEYLAGRALLWKLKSGETFMDRIYTSRDNDIDLFKEYAKENGWLYKKYNDSESIAVINASGETDFFSLECQIDKYMTTFPYMDTMKYYIPNTGIISSKHPDSKLYLKLESTEASYSDVYCYNCDGYKNGYISCDICNGDTTNICGECDGEGSIECDCEDKNCDKCEDGFINCKPCKSSGIIECMECDGYGYKKCSKCEDYRFYDDDEW